MRLRLFTLAAGVSAVLCVGVVIFVARGDEHSLSVRGWEVFPDEGGLEALRGDDLVVQDIDAAEALNRPGRDVLGVRWSQSVGSLSAVDDGTGYAVTLVRYRRFPIWLAVSLAAALPALWVCFAFRRRAVARRLSKNLCPACGYDRRDTPGRCPECGAVPAATGAE